MNQITQIAVEETMDPMQVVLESLFKNKEVSISNRILGRLKKSHSYMMRPEGKKELYTFFKRARGTDTVFTFVVRSDVDGNFISKWEYFTELGVTLKREESLELVTKEKVHIMFQ